MFKTTRGCGSGAGNTKEKGLGEMLGIVIGVIVLVVWALGAVVWMMEPGERKQLIEKLAMHWRQVEVDEEEEKTVEAHERLRREMKRATQKKD